MRHMLDIFSKFSFIFLIIFNYNISFHYAIINVSLGKRVGILLKGRGNTIRFITLSHINNYNLKMI